jgi:hypothetical protein
MGDLQNVELLDLAARIRVGDLSPVAVTRVLLDHYMAFRSQ